MKKLMDARRAKNQDSNQLTIKDLMSGNVSEDLWKEIVRPEKQQARQEVTKEYMNDFFNRNLSRPNKDLPLPPYLLPFSFPKVEEYNEEIFKELKSGRYDIREEERMLTKLHAALNQRGDVADKILAQIGLVNVKRRLQMRE